LEYEKKVTLQNMILCLFFVAAVKILNDNNVDILHTPILGLWYLMVFFTILDEIISPILCWLFLS